MLTCIRRQADCCAVSLDCPPSPLMFAQAVGSGCIGNVNRIPLVLIYILAPTIEDTYLSGSILSLQGLKIACEIL